MPFQHTSTLPPIQGIPTFHYSPSWGECSIIHRLDEVLVIGDPNNASYEWVIIIDNRVIAHSDAGYGQSSVAMKDGLVQFHDAGEAKSIRQLAREFAEQARKVSGDDDVKITVCLTNERETTSIERRDAASLEREGISMKNVRGEWITQRKS